VYAFQGIGTLEFLR